MKTSKIKVLHFTYLINRNDFIDTVIRYANPVKFEMHAAVMTTESNIQNPQYALQNIPLYTTTTELTFLGAIRTVFRLIPLLKKLKPEIIHAHHFYESFIAMLAIILSGTKTKLIVGRHYHNEFYLTAKGIKLRLYLFLEALLHRFSSAVIAPSSAIVTLLTDQKVAREKIYQIPYGFEFDNEKYREIPEEEKQTLRKEFDLSDKKVFVNISRQSPVKGQAYLLQAIKEIGLEDKVVFVFVGSGSEHEKLKILTQKLGIESRVRFTHWRKDGYKFLSLADAVIHPSLQEAFPQIMVEAMAMGKFLIITPVSGATDLVKHLTSGYLAEFKSPESLTNAIRWFLGNLKEAQLIAETAKAKVRKDLAIEKIIGQFEAVYERIACYYGN